ncbi:hypothetical protein PFISCL1PPCAC_21978, partial [Pristionchus fissidentatus]
FMTSQQGNLKPGTYEIKLGGSWDTPPRDRTTFHTLKYDFKPKSVANETETYVAMGQNGDVQVAVPAENDQLTMYKGAQKPVKEARECLLFFNPRTGEVRLEKVTSNITVKKTRNGDTEPATEQYLRGEIARLRTTSTSRGITSSSPPKEEDEMMTSSSSSMNMMGGGRRSEERDESRSRMEKDRKRKTSSSSSSSSSSGSSSSSDSDEEENYRNAPSLNAGSQSAATAPPPMHQQQQLSSSLSSSSSFTPSAPLLPPVPPPVLSRSREPSHCSSAMEMSSSDESDDDDEKLLEREMGAIRPQQPPAAAESMPLFDIAAVTSPVTPPRHTAPAPVAKSASLFNDLALSESSDEDD